VPPIPWCAHQISLKQVFKPMEQPWVAPGYRRPLFSDNRDAAVSLSA
jgi:hypothetical protein